MVRPWVVGLGFTAVPLLIVGVGLVLFRRGRAVRERNQEIKESETTPICDVQPGTVKVGGIAKPIQGEEGRVRGIQTKMEGIARSLEIAILGGRRQNTWETVFAEHDAVPFLVDDGTGKVRVDPPTSSAAKSTQGTSKGPPTTGRYVLEADARTEVEAGEEAPERLQQYQDDHGINSVLRGEIAGIGGTYQRRYSEGFVEPGDEVTVRAEYHETPADWDTQKYVLGAGDNPDSFLISNKPEEAVGTEDSTWGTIMYVGGIVGIGTGVLAIIGIWLVWFLLA